MKARARVVAVVERVALALEQRQVRVHAAAGLVGVRLRHEGRPHALRERDLLDDVPERHDVVRGGQRVGVPQVDLLLAGGDLVVAELDGDADAFEGQHGLAAEVAGDRVRGVVEVAAAVDRDRHRAVQRAVLDQEELDLGVRVEGEALLGRLGEHAAQHVPRVGPGGAAVGEQDVAEHPGALAADTTLEREDLERRRVGHGDHVRLGDPGEALDGRAVDAHALLEGGLELGRCDGHAFQGAEHVGEPKPDKTDVALFERTKHELLLSVHVNPSYLPGDQSLPVPLRRDYADHTPPGRPGKART
jgi:hypothetical protein